MTSKTILLLLSLGVHSAACRPREPLSALRSDEEAFTFEDVRALLANEALGIRTVEGLLRNLPESLRRNVVLLRDSGSTQDASEQFPRVILYTEGARLMLTFNGEASQSGYDLVESIEFDAARDVFVFRELEFPADRGESGEPHVSRDNPNSCASCHRRKGRPIFDTYPEFPDAFFNGRPVTAGVRAAYDAFRASAAGHPRYRHLLALETHADPARQAAGEPARTLNALIQQRMDEFLAREVLAHPRFAEIERALLAASAGCSAAEVEALVPEGERARFPKTLEAVATETRYRSPDVTQTVISLRWIFESYDLPTSHWGTSRLRPYSFSRGPDDPGPRVWEALGRTEERPCTPVR
jgi:hypothetical protein